MSDIGAGVEGSGMNPGPAAAAAEVDHLPTAPQAPVNQTGTVEAAAQQQNEHVIYNCRMCRRAVFNAADIESHEPAQHNFHRRKVTQRVRTAMGEAAAARLLPFACVSPGLSPSFARLSFSVACARCGWLHGTDYETTRVEAGT